MSERGPSAAANVRSEEAKAAAMASDWPEVAWFPYAAGYDAGAAAERERVLAIVEELSAQGYMIHKELKRRIEGL